MWMRATPMPEIPAECARIANRDKRIESSLVRVNFYKLLSTDNKL